MKWQLYVRNYRKAEMNFKLSHSDKVKILQAICIVGLLAIPIWFDAKLLVVGLILGWVFHGVGLCVTLHWLCTHREFEPRNSVVKSFLLYVSVLCTLGSPIAWAVTHRAHHKYTDLVNDPTYPHGNAWHVIKNFFSYYDSVKGEKLCAKDLFTDKQYLFFHRNYFKLLAVYVFGLLLASPVYIVYFYAVPVVFSVVCIGWVSTLAHLPKLSVFGYRNFDTPDTTYNSHFWQVVTMGEGLHNNHHANAGNRNTAIKWHEFDIAALIIRMIGKPNV
jgi:stearoyl-CoA desaturase (delta-9 desaturase)